MLYGAISSHQIDLLTIIEIPSQKLTLMLKYDIINFSYNLYVVQSSFYISIISHLKREIQHC